MLRPATVQSDAATPAFAIGAAYSTMTAVLRWLRPNTSVTAATDRMC